MAGGEGTRLRPLTCMRPKPMVPVVNKPVMEHIVELLKRHGIFNIAVTLQYMPYAIKDYFEDVASSVSASADRSSCRSKPVSRWIKKTWLTW